MRAKGANGDHQEEDVRRWADANLDPARDRMVVLSEGVQAATTRTGQAT